MADKTDAIKAGQGPAEKIAAFINTYQWPIVLIWFFWPSISKNAFGPQSTNMTMSSNMSSSFNDTNGTNGTAQMMIPDEPATWLYSVFRMGSFVLMMAMFMLISIYVQQENMLYVPAQPFQFMHQNPPNYNNPGERNMRYEMVEITTDDGIKLRGWFILQGENNAEAKKHDTFVYFHENAGNIGLRMDYFVKMHSLGVNLLIVAYRGFSDSEGHPSEAGLKLDGIAITNWIKTQGQTIDLGKVWLIGRSLGGAVGINTLAEIPNFYQGALIENTFVGISEMADKLFPFLTFIPTIKKAMLRINWDSKTTIKNVKTPILFITGTEDTFVPPEMIQDLYACHKGYRELMVVQGGGHNDTYMKAGDSYGETMKKFMKAVVAMKAGNGRQLPCTPQFEEKCGGQAESMDVNVTHKKEQ